jgi:hypothetical protein
MPVTSVSSDIEMRARDPRSAHSTAFEPRDPLNLRARVVEASALDDLPNMTWGKRRQYQRLQSFHKAQNEEIYQMLKVGLEPGGTGRLTV